MDILEDLKYRGLIYQATNLEGLKKRLKKGKIVLYCGFDPTAESLHIGNLLHLITLKRFLMAGHKPIILIGGGTGLIGDPSGKKEERPLSDEQQTKQWKERIKKQVKKIFNNSQKIQVLDNYDWLNKISVMPFFRDIGTQVSVVDMLHKDSIKNRLEAGTGLSFLEFSYMVFQAYDFYHLYKKYNCELQIGGSDQWGNITAGVELIRKKLNQEVFGLCSPLVTKADGTKFGKTEKGTIWLDPQLTTPYQFYQFWINVEDGDVINYLKFFTFLSRNEIERLALQISNRPEKREAQKTLAFEITKIVHGDKEAKEAEKISQALFYNDIKSLNQEELKIALEDVPSFTLMKNSKISLIDLLVRASISSSKRQAREDIKNKSISINGQVVDNLEQMITPSFYLYGKYLVIRRGKKNYHLIILK